MKAILLLFAILYKPNNYKIILLSLRKSVLKLILRVLVEIKEIFNKTNLLI